MRHATVAMVGLAALAALGCGPKKWRPPVMIASDFQAQRIDPIVVLSSDARIDTSIDVNVRQELGEEAVPILRERGYTATLGTPATTTPLLPDALAVADADTIHRIAPPGVRWLMVLCLVDVSTELTFGSTGNAELAGFLFDTEKGALIWRDRGLGQVGQGSLVGMALISVMDEEAIHAALGHMLASLPVQEGR